MSKIEKLDTLLNIFLSDKGYSTFCKEFDIIHKWVDIVGEKVALKTECIKVENGVLFVSVTSSSWRQEMTFLKSEIINKIKNNYNCKSITDIVFL